MMRAREDVNIQNIKSLKQGNRKWYKSPKVQNGGMRDKMQTPTGVCLEMWEEVQTGDSGNSVRTVGF